VLWLSLLLPALVFCVPLAIVGGVWIWARWLARRSTAPRFTSRVAYALVIAACLPIAWGYGFGIVHAVGLLGLPAANLDDGPSQKSRVLAEGIAEAMNCGALGALIALVSAVWLLFCTVRWRPARP
jgi:hypothetical protein